MAETSTVQRIFGNYMKFAALTAIAPGNTIEEQCMAIAASGCSGIETLVFPDTPLEQWQTKLRRATENANVQPVAIILGGLALHQPGQINWVSETLAAIAELKAAALLTVEYQAQDPLPIFPPYPKPPLAEQAQVDAAMAEISQIATKLDLPIYLEPITQFESRFWRDVDTVLAICRRLENPRIGLCLDFHNMNITEAGIEATIQRAGSWIHHIHLADNNRRLPGQGHINFSTGLQTLQKQGYTGWYTFECGVEGNFQHQVKQTIHMLEQLTINKIE